MFTVYALRTMFDRIAILCEYSVPLVIAAFVAIWGRQGSDRAPPCGAPLREHGGTDGRILQRDHAENRDGEPDFVSFDTFFCKRLIKRKITLVFISKVIVFNLKHFLIRTIWDLVDLFSQFLISYIFVKIIEMI